MDSNATKNSNVCAASPHSGAAPQPSASRSIQALWPHEGSQNRPCFLKGFEYDVSPTMKSRVTSGLHLSDCENGIVGR